MAINQSELHWEGLSAAIVLQAMKDYYVLLIKYHHCDRPCNRAMYRGQIQEVENFFRSDWMQTLYDSVPGENIIRLIRKGVKARNYKMPGRQFNWRLINSDYKPDEDV